MKKTNRHVKLRLNDQVMWLSLDQLTILADDMVPLKVSLNTQIQVRGRLSIISDSIVFEVWEDISQILQ